MKIVKYLLISFALLLLSFDAAFACRCRREKPSRDLSRFVAVFVGKVTDEGDLQSRKVRFRVERIWKGELVDEIVIYASNNSCEWYFKKGESYLVYAHASTGGHTLRTHKCTRTGRLVDAAEDLKMLGEGQSPSSKSRSSLQQREAELGAAPDRPQPAFHQPSVARRRLSLASGGR